MSLILIKNKSTFDKVTANIKVVQLLPHTTIMNFALAYYTLVVYS